jgi:hypothetical protein
VVCQLSQIWNTRCRVASLITELFSSDSYFWYAKRYWLYTWHDKKPFTEVLYGITGQTDRLSGEFRDEIQQLSLHYGDQIGVYYPDAGDHRRRLFGADLQYGAGSEKRPRQLSALSFLAALKPITSAINYATLNFLNIGAVFLIGIELGRINGIKSLFPGLLAVICFICVTPTTVEMMVDGQMHVVKDVLLRQFSDTRSLFLGMFIAILSVEIYCWLEGRKG